MIMIGTIFTGSIHYYEDQGIRSKFFMLGLPLFPLSTYYKLAGNKAIAIPINGKSIWKGYSRTTLLAMGIAGVMFARELSLPQLLLALAALLNGLYSWMTFPVTGKKEEATRSYISRAFEYNMLPELLPPKIRFALYEELENVCNTTLGIGADWEAMIAQEDISEHNKYLLFTMAHYNYVITGEEKYAAMKEKILSIHLSPVMALV
ncbi:hypothetical protein [Chitinophaga solisilvae]|uniref:Uncharacterized protein n=1 Tax=Chitinophaga solisilvae TaxID=1233460 RepID=A0A433WFD9_9BACT|nr:hypothetical protein [Chitinophaga solisilvae]NSL89522.1 hypothetical protein [Chitinophaga solisilvae]